MLKEHLKIGVVGNCASGKSTLVKALRNLGYNTVNIPQEHSISPKFWWRLAPNFLIYLRCSILVAGARREIPWGNDRLEEQWKILEDAKANADLFLDTDNMSAEEILDVCLQAIKIVMTRENRYE